MNYEAIKKYVHEEDIVPLCEMVNDCIESGNENDRIMLSEAISGIIGQWLYDFYCGKGGDPSRYPYIQGIKALETLDQESQLADIGEFYSICCDYFQEAGDFPKARDYAGQSEQVLKEALSLNSKDQNALRHLIYLYETFPVNDADEGKNKFLQALSLVDEAIIIADRFFATKLYMIYNEKAPASLQSRLEKERDAFFLECLQKAKGEPLFALDLVSEYLRILDSSDQSFIPRLKKEVLSLLENLAPAILKENNFDHVPAGHIFSRVGEIFERTDFFLVAEALFEKAMTLPRAFPLIKTYIAKAKEKRALLSNSSELHLEIKKSYLNEWRNYSHDLSYLSHAVEFLLKPAFSQPRELIQPEILNEIILMAKASEKLGQGYYWFPYAHLFWANILLKNEEEAKLWLGKGYCVLTTLIESELKKLLLNAEVICSSSVIIFVKKLVWHLENNPDKEFWRRRISYEEVSQFSFKELDAWLVSIPQG